MLRGGLSQLDAGDHCCGIFATQSEEQAVVGDYIAQGLVSGDKVLYVGDGPDRDGIMLRVQAAGIDVPAQVRAGHLELASPRDVYLPKGRFDLDATLTKLAEAEADATAMGFPRLRASGEMSWAMADPESRTALLEYESKLSAQIRGTRLHGICQYDLERFPPDVLRDVLEAHPLALLGRELHDNFYYVPPEEFLGPMRQEATLRRWLGNLEERSRLESEREAAQSAQLELERQKAVNAFRTRFLNMASHELRTPLTPMRIQLDLLDRDQLGPETQRRLDILTRGTDRLSHLVRDLIEVARLESGRFPVRPRQCDLAALLETFLNDYQPVAQARSITLRAEPPAKALPAWVDPMRVQQVLSNLVENALRLTPSGGTITIEAEATLGGGARLRVSDTGAGLDAEQLASLFQPFTRLHDHVEGRQRGSGLGLFIVRTIMEQHGGLVRAHSDGPGHGSRFEVEFPPVPPSPDAQAAA